MLFNSMFLSIIIDAFHMHVYGHEVALMELVTERQISAVLDRFYDRVRKDELLGPVFAVVEDWDQHLKRLGEFWSSVMLMSGRYKGNPVSMHLLHADRIRPEMFDRWLGLWEMTTQEKLPPQSAVAMQAKARRIAGRLTAAIHGNRPGPAAPAAVGVATRPYRVTAEFSEETVPRPLLTAHSLKAGTWGVIRVRSGAIRYRDEPLSPGTILDESHPGFVPPEIPHRLELIGPVTLAIEFYDQEPANLQQA